MSAGDGGVDRHTDRRPAAGALFRVFLETAFAAHLVLAAVYWRLSPKGFPVSHSRFWLNSVLPLVAIAVACAGLVGMLQQRRRAAGFGALCFASAWAAAALSGRVMFPLSLRGVWGIGLAIAILGAGCFVLLVRGERRTNRSWFCCSFLAALVGIFVIWVQLPPQPSTKPLDELGPAAPANGQAEAISPLIKLGEGNWFYPAAGQLTLQRGGVILRCSPLLSFDRISPDGFWSILAPPASEQPRVLQQTVRPGAHFFHYRDGSAIILPAPAVTGTVQLTSYTPVRQDAFSHLNSFCVLEVSGHRRLSLAFSPCRETTIDVLPADYPAGRPARFAYLDGSETFSVVEATSGEKGPFHTLASGRLRRGEPLAIALHDEGRPVVSIILEDWSRQASTALSPTAGWGVAANAMEFQRLDAAEDSPITIWITLAATSVGRGWETVGHRAGIYRNRVAFRSEPP